MKLKYILNEMKQVGILYHYTDILSLQGISKGLVLISGFENNFISFTRNGSGISGWAGSQPCRLILDGNVLSNKYKIKTIQNLKKHHLAEERIYKDKVYISDSLICVQIIENRYSISQVDKIKELYSNYFFEIVEKWKPYKG